MYSLARYDLLGFVHWCGSFFSDGFLLLLDTLSVPGFLRHEGSLSTAGFLELHGALRSNGFLDLDDSHCFSGLLTWIGSLLDIGFAHCPWRAIDHGFLFSSGSLGIDVFCVGRGLAKIEWVS